MTLRKAIKGFFNLFTFFTCFGFACCCCVVLMFFPMIIVNFKGVICLTVCYLGVKLQNGISPHNGNLIEKNHVKGNEELF